MSGKDGGWLLPFVNNPAGRIPACICVPDDENHIAAFWGALQELGYWFNWQRDDGHNALPVSVLWNEIVTEAHQKWLDGIMCTSCGELIACLQPLIDEINAKLDAIQTGVNDLQYGPGNSEIGVPLSPAEQAQNQAGDSNPSCDKDILWAQCLQLVQYTNQLIVDALEAAEAATNNIELADILAGFPGIDEVGADVVTGYITLLQDGIAENYVAEYTAAKEQEIACAIFCAALVDCEITIERVVNVYNGLVAPYFSGLPATFATLGAFMSYFVDQNVGSDVVVYLLHYLIWAGGSLANIFLGDIGTKTLQTLLLLAVNDANNDWQLLCECAAQYCDDMDAGLGALTFLPSVTKPFGVFSNAGAVYNQTSGGVWVATGGYDNNLGCVMSTQTPGTSGNERTLSLIVDLGQEFNVTGVSWRGKRVAFGGGAAAVEYLVFLDDSGALVDAVNMGTTGATWELRLYSTPKTARYVIPCVSANSIDCWFDDICVDFG